MYENFDKNIEGTNLIFRINLNNGIPKVLEFSVFEEKQNILGKKGEMKKYFKSLLYVTFDNDGPVYITGATRSDSDYIGYVVDRNVKNVSSRCSINDYKDVIKNVIKNLEYISDFEECIINAVDDIIRDKKHIISERLGYDLDFINYHSKICHKRIKVKCIDEDCPFINYIDVDNFDIKVINGIDYAVFGGYKMMLPTKVATECRNAILVAKSYGNKILVEYYYNPSNIMIINNIELMYK